MNLWGQVFRTYDGNAQGVTSLRLVVDNDALHMRYAIE